MSGPDLDVHFAGSLQRRWREGKRSEKEGGRERRREEALLVGVGVQSMGLMLLSWLTLTLNLTGG